MQRYQLRGKLVLYSPAHWNHLGAFHAEVQLIDTFPNKLLKRYIFHKRTNRRTKHRSLHSHRWTCSE